MESIEYTGTVKKTLTKVKVKEIEYSVDEYGFVTTTDPKISIKKLHLIKKKATPDEKVTIQPITEVKEAEKEIPMLPPSRGKPSIPAENIMNLIMQMASSGVILGKGKIDERKLTHISDLGQVALSHFAYRGYVDKIRFWAFIYEELLALAVSIGGERANQIIKLTSAYSGSPQPEFAQKPNWLLRNTTQRNWKEKAEQEGKTII